MNSDNIEPQAQILIDKLEGGIKNMIAKIDADELVLICAQDIVNAWPTLTMRTMGEMTKRIDTLRQALEAAK